MNLVKNYLFSLIKNSYLQNDKNIRSFMDKNDEASVVDLGCDDGIRTKKMGLFIGTKKLFGVEVVKKRLHLAKKRGVIVSECNLNNVLPFRRNSFDVVHSNQVIEHLYDTDTFVQEIFRILKPGAYAIISTENLSSWHNIFALLLGFQPFSMTNFSNRGNIGNPLALWNGKITKNSAIKSWQHNRLFSYRGLTDLFNKHGFDIERVKTSGYYPLPGFFSKIDPLHGHWIAIKVRKPKEKK
ncbi:MAG: Methyltransferase type 11 [Candidatus Woesebacteria bacterium GW2011_GWE1_45_18]|uniref:Methyltransferase type 11 n=1 Tax=Candidatus Woesebacteria bacterium GW2011_GWE1_45_18 TaxID=1618598 RepID=A0A0G1M681_9BACT|nr:MAG: Methyltransferase type 11 [Candidatus Woesebacteria bacterium GW2011_GWE1_45_18]HBP51576.1 class I SAM-dependent methyltransferase [Candidatus Shapirobacteria bacterium]